MNYNEAANYEALADFKSIDTSVNVDGISTEYRDITHINVIEYAEVDVVAEDSSQKLWHHNRSKTLIRNEKGEGCHGWDNYFMSPLQVDNIINKSKEYDHTNSQ